MCRISSFERFPVFRTQITAMSYDDLYAQIHLLSDQSPYDLIRMDMAWLDHFGQTVYLPLEEAGGTDSQCIAKIVEQTHSGYTHSGDVLYALPFDPSVQILLYRRDLFEDAVLQRTYYERFKKPLFVPQTMGE